MNIDINKLHGLIDDFNYECIETYNSLDEFDPVRNEQQAILDTIDIFRKWIEECKQND